MEQYVIIGLIAVVLITTSIGILTYRVVKKIPKKLRLDVVTLFILGSILIIFSFVKSPNFHALDKEDDSKPHGILNPISRHNKSTPSNTIKEEDINNTSDEFDDTRIESILKNDITLLDPHRDGDLTCDNYDIHVEDLMKYDNLKHLVKGKYIIEEIGHLEPEEIDEKYRELLPNPYYIKTKATDNGVVVSAYGNMFSADTAIPKIGEIIEFKGFVLEKMTGVDMEKGEYVIILLGGFR